MLYSDRTGWDIHRTFHTDRLGIMGVQDFSRHIMHPAACADAKLDRPRKTLAVRELTIVHQCANPIKLPRAREDIGMVLDTK